MTQQYFAIFYAKLNTLEKMFTRKFFTKIDDHKNISDYYVIFYTWKFCWLKRDWCVDFRIIELSIYHYQNQCSFYLLNNQYINYLTGELRKLPIHLLMIKQ